MDKRKGEGEEFASRLGCGPIEQQKGLDGHDGNVIGHEDGLESAGGWFQAPDRTDLPPARLPFQTAWEWTWAGVG